MFICYGAFLSNHAALRIEMRDGAVFWDPAGGFGHANNAVVRKNDVPWSVTPSVYDYWQYREVGCAEPFMEMYEWDLDDDEAKKLHDMIRHSALSVRREEGEFNTGTAGLFCSIAVCDFLQRFQSHRMHVPTQWLMPHKLAEHSWSQKPSRVWVFEHDEDTKVATKQ